MLHLVTPIRWGDPPLTSRRLFMLGEPIKADQCRHPASSPSLQWGPITPVACGLPTPTENDEPEMCSKQKKKPVRNCWLWSISGVLNAESLLSDTLSRS